jgi:hypothetical protein
MGNYQVLKKDSAPWSSVDSLFVNVQILLR